MPNTRLAVLCSGEGTNLQAIITAIRRRKLSAQIAVVVSDKPQARALKRARRAGICAVHLDPKAYRTRAGYDAALVRVIKKAGARWVVLAGFMRILSAGFIRKFPNRVFNIHPALLPAFRGGSAVEDALSYGVKVTGVTVHFADAKVDHGPVILQAVVPVKPKDTKATLLRRVHQVEHQIYPKAIGLAVRGKLKVRGRKVVVQGGKK